MVNTDPQQPTYPTSQPASQQPAYAPGAVVPLSTGEARQWGMLSHLIPLIATVLSGGTLGFVASLVVYLLYKDRDTFVRQHAANSLNIQLMTLVGVIVSIVLMFVLIGFVTYPLVFALALVLHGLGAMKANNGEQWDPPVTYRFVK